LCHYFLLNRESPLELLILNKNGDIIDARTAVEDQNKGSANFGL